MVRFTEAEVIEVWDRWQAGDANRLIGRDLGRSAASIRAFVESWGGVRPRVRRRSERHLSLDERAGRTELEETPMLTKNLKKLEIEVFSRPVRWQLPSVVFLPYR